MGLTLRDNMKITKVIKNSNDVPQIVRPIDDSQHKSNIVILKERGRFKLSKRDDTYIVIGGKKIETYKSKMWAEKRFDRASSIFARQE